MFRLCANFKCRNNSFINHNLLPYSDEQEKKSISAFYSVIDLFHRFWKQRNSWQIDTKWCYNMNIHYKIRHSIPKFVTVRGLAWLRALLSNVSVESTQTHVDLTANNVVKGVLQKLMFDVCPYKNYVDEHQPFQLKIISKLVSIE